MSLKKNRVIKWTAFAIATLLAALTIFYLPRVQRKIPKMPGDSLHIRITRINECLQCHSESGDNPLPQTHVAKEQCLYCHALQK